MNNSIYIRRKRKIYVEPGNNNLPADYVHALLMNLQELGFTLSDELNNVIKTISIERLSNLYKQLINDLKLTLGARVKFKPMYPNFPEQVVNASWSELTNNAISHYKGDLLGRRILPKYEKKQRKSLLDKTELKVIELGTKEEFNLIFTRILNSKTSISETDKNDINWYIKNYGDDVEKYIPDEIPLKENVALICSALLKHTTIAGTILQKQVHTATDVIRIAVALSDGDLSLAENTRFRNFPKKERRLLLNLMENCQSLTEDMLKYKNRWKRLGERLHPFDYKNKFPSVCESFDIIRNEKPFKTFNSKVESSILKRDVITTLNLLRERPGEYARRLDHLLRLYDNKSKILSTFEEIASSISSTLLLQVFNHFKHRNEQSDLRVFFPKGNVGRAMAITNNLPLLNPDTCNKVVEISKNALINKFRTYKDLAKVFIDDRLIEFNVPFAQRSSSKAFRTIVRGSKTKLPTGDTIRFFIYWKDGNTRTDIDLNAVGLNENHLFKTVISYYNLKDIGGHHSGDITSAPNGASEFIDININDFLSMKIRYVVMSVHSYTWQPLCDLPECFAGFMMREYPQSGEIYEPKTIQNKFDLTANTKIAIPMIIDLFDRKIIWTDIALTRNKSYNNNVYHNLSSLGIISKAMTTFKKPNLFDLFEMHSIARGTKVDDMEKADTVFSLDTGITPFDTDQIISEFL